ncbi:MAG: hypothetical protein D6694_03670 [Gammaproteobacteria bacterium]|nr:MAG: hypothetical protein D6694_03670 [Gammaproteobacteria bacterium]
MRVEKENPDSHSTLTPVPPGQYAPGTFTQEQIAYLISLVPEKRYHGVLRLYLKGCTQKETERKLLLSPHTVSDYRRLSRRALERHGIVIRAFKGRKRAKIAEINWEM